MKYTKKYMVVPYVETNINTNEKTSDKQTNTNEKTNDKQTNISKCDKENLIKELCKISKNNKKDIFEKILNSKLSDHEKYEKYISLFKKKLYQKKKNTKNSEVQTNDSETNQQLIQNSPVKLSLPELPLLSNSNKRKLFSTSILENSKLLDKRARKKINYTESPFTPIKKKKYSNIQKNYKKNRQIQDEDEDKSKKKLENFLILPNESINSISKDAFLNKNIVDQNWTHT